MVDDQAVTDGEDVFLFTPEWLDGDTLRSAADGGVRDLDLATDSVPEVPFEATVEIPGADHRDVAA